MNENSRHPDSKLHGGDSDGMLRRRFAVLRREEEQQAPEFDRLWQVRPEARERHGRWFVAAACALIALALLCIRSVQHPDDKTVASITEWKAPTDFLLETPGRDLLRTVPEIGQWHFYSAIYGAMPSPARKKVLP
ncbi:MAG TPA: hypothetical protein VHW72_14395 [Candidatus Angelobacter sp.]|jgi:hypothetical protein|nr:hypothetical protein [Candidatus Angelobacter sp.]